MINSPELEVDSGEFLLALQFETNPEPVVFKVSTDNFELPDF